MLNPNTNILLTGVTGLIGGELVRKFVLRSCGTLYCLIRPKPGETAEARLVERLRRSGDTDLLEAVTSTGRAGARSPRIRAVAGDVTQPLFGMSREDAAEVLASTNMFLHCASELSFIRDESCRETNIAGMRNLIDLAGRCKRLPEIVHISTATVCGNVSDRCVMETDGDHPDGDHYNEYTRSKAAAERVLRDSGLPALVIRPSIVLSANLPSQDFARAILWFLPLLNEFDAVPIGPSSRVDIVPVSFVVDAMVGLLERETLRYDCYHISAGHDQALRCSDAAAYLDYFYGRINPLHLVPPTEWTRQMHRQYVGTAHQRKLFATLKYYLPFVNMNVAYDNGRLREELGDAAVKVPPMTDYLGDLLRLVTPELQANGTLERTSVNAAATPM